MTYCLKDLFGTLWVGRVSTTEVIQTVVNLYSDLAYISKIVSNISNISRFQNLTNFEKYVKLISQLEM